MRSFISVLALTIVLSASATILTENAEARERSKTFTLFWHELRQRANSHTTTTSKTESTPAKTTPTTKPSGTTTAPAPSKEDNVAVSDQYLEAVRAEIHRLTNIERSKAGVATLAHDTKLAQVAEGHSKDMLKRNYFSHTSPEGCNMACRLAKTNYAYWAWGENIAWRKSGTQPEAKALAKHFVDSWMASSGHKRNILSKDFTHEGIGLARSGNLVYVTASFADPR